MLKRLLLLVSAVLLLAAVMPGPAAGSSSPAASAEDPVLPASGPQPAPLPTAADQVTVAVTHLNLIPVLTAARPSAPNPPPTPTSGASSGPALVIPAEPRPVLNAPSAAPARALRPEDWKNWPVIPASLSPELIALYRTGIAGGNNPRAVSVLGDCQAEPHVFWGVYESQAGRAAFLPPELQQTLARYAGSFNRLSPTVKSGSTSGSMLFGLWNDNPEKKCEPGETPLACELRTQRPSIVFIHLGTHWEARNERYMTLIIEQVLEHGAVPVLGTKGDNLEQDERLNLETAVLAQRYGLPMWNFWAAIQDLPDHGIDPNDPMYLTDAGLDAQRETALQVLDAVWRMAER